MAGKLRGRDAARLLLGLLRRHLLAHTRVAGRRTVALLQPRVDTAERQLRRHLDGLRRPVLVQQLQQLVWQRAAAALAHKHVQEQGHRHHCRRGDQPPQDAQRLVHLPHRDLQRRDLRNDRGRHLRQRRRRRNGHAGCQAGRDPVGQQRHGRGLERHARPRPQERQCADRREGLPGLPAQRPGLHGLSLRHGEGLRRLVYGPLQQCLATGLLGGRVLGRQPRQGDRLAQRDQGGRHDHERSLRLPVPLHRARCHQQGQLGQPERHHARLTVGLPPVCRDLHREPRHRVSLVERAPGPHQEGHPGRQRLLAGHAWHPMRLPEALAGLQARNKRHDRRPQAGRHHQHQHLCELQECSHLLCREGERRPLPPHGGSGPRRGSRHLVAVHRDHERLSL